MATQARYENTTMNEETGKRHSKYWQITTISPSEVKAEWGKIGTRPTAGATKIYPIAVIEKLIREKLAKGYELISYK